MFVVPKVRTNLNSNMLTIITFSVRAHEDASEDLMLLKDIMDKGFVPWPIDNYRPDRNYLSKLIFSFIWDKYTVCDVHGVTLLVVFGAVDEPLASCMMVAF